MAQNLCNHSKEEICNALQIIKNICKNNNCSTCPFGFYNGDDHCQFQRYSPCDFDIGNSDDIWRAI